MLSWIDAYIVLQVAIIVFGVIRWIELFNARRGRYRKLPFLDFVLLGSVFNLVLFAVGQKIEPITGEELAKHAIEGAIAGCLAFLGVLPINGKR